MNPLMDPTVVEAITADCAWYDVSCVAGSGLRWIANLVLWFGYWITEGVLGAMGWVFEHLPDPCGLGDICGTIAASNALMQIGSVASGIGYFFELVQFGPGLKLILCAYLARFILRRIPGIG